MTSTWMTHPETKRITRKVGKLSALFVILTCLFHVPVNAQTGGQGAIQGSVTDTTGAAIPNATVIVTNVNTSIATTRPTSSAGLYDISPLTPGSLHSRSPGGRLRIPQAGKRPDQRP